jgi:hypothetical protein
VNPFDFPTTCAEELQTVRDAVQKQIDDLEYRRDALDAEINRRTSPWPWPKTPSLMARLWAGEAARMFIRGLDFDPGAKAVRDAIDKDVLDTWRKSARPNSGE